MRIQSAPSKLIVLFVAAILCSTAFAGELEKRVKVTLAWKRRGNDVHVTASLHNQSGKTLVDPTVRVTFYNKDNKEVATASKTYFTRVGKGGKKRLETRIWSEIDTSAVRAEGELDDSTFE